MRMILHTEITKEHLCLRKNRRFIQHNLPAFKVDNFFILWICFSIAVFYFCEMVEQN